MAFLTEKNAKVPQQDEAAYYQTTQVGNDRYISVGSQADTSEYLPHPALPGAGPSQGDTSEYRYLPNLMCMHNKKSVGLKPECTECECLTLLSPLIPFLSYFSSCSHSFWY